MNESASPLALNLPQREANGWSAAIGHFLVQRDFFASLNKYLPWRSAFGSVLLTGCAAVLCGLVLHAHAFVLVFGAAAVLVVGVVWPWVCTRCLSASLTFEMKRTTEGQPVGMSLHIRNWLPASVWGLRIKAGRADPGAVSLAVVPGWRTTTFAWTYRPEGPGEYPREPLYMVTGFPFGLWESRRLIQTNEKLLIWPRVFPLSFLPEAAATDHTREGTVLQSKAGTGGDFLGVRPYRRGDCLRRIHWRQTARHQKLIVCERQRTACPRIQVIVDAQPESHAGRWPNGSREWALRIAASIIDNGLVRGASVEVIVDRQVIPSGRGLPHRQRLFDALARIPTNEGETLASQLQQPACRAFQDGLQIVVTTDRTVQNGAVPSDRRATRLVVLRADVFEQGPNAYSSTAMTANSLTFRPWIWIDEAVQVEEQFRRSWKEVLCAG